MRIPTGRRERPFLARKLVKSLFFLVPGVRILSTWSQSIRKSDTARIRWQDWPGSGGKWDDEYTLRIRGCLWVRGLRRSIILPPGTDGQCMARVWPGKRRIIHCTGDKAVRILVLLLHTGVGVGGVLMQHALVDRHWSIECTTQRISP